MPKLPYSSQPYLMRNMHFDTSLPLSFIIMTRNLPFFKDANAFQTSKRAPCERCSPFMTPAKQGHLSREGEGDTAGLTDPLSCRTVPVGRLHLQNLLCCYRV